VPEDYSPDRRREQAMRALTRAAAAIGMHALDRQTPPAEHARRRWGADRAMDDLVLRAAVSPASLSNTPTLAAVSVAFLSALTPQSAGADLLARGIGLNEMHDLQGYRHHLQLSGLKPALAR
jgi:hypothetical protein